MKKYAAYLVLSSLLLAAGWLAIVGSFGLYFLPGLLAHPLQTVAQSLVLFAAGSVALSAHGKAWDAGWAARRMAEQRVR